MIFCLPVDIKDNIFSYLNIVNRRGRYVKMLHIEKFGEVNDMLIFQQENTKKIHTSHGMITEKILFRDDTVEVKIFHYEYDNSIYLLNSTEFFKE